MQGRQVGAGLPGVRRVVFSQVEGHLVIFFFFFLMLKAREDAIRSHSVGGRRLRNVPDKDESGKLTGSTKRPCLLPALNFTGGRGSGKSHIQ